MTNYDILIYNKHQLGEILKPELKVETDGKIEYKVKYDYVETVSMLSYNNRMFYEKNLNINGSLIFDMETGAFYVLLFDPMIFYESSQIKVK
jgi:hypothetical protein